MRSSREDIEKIIKEKIKLDEAIGESASGSGHMSMVSFELKNFDFTESTDSTVINYSYVVITETEFTYFPDNPPYTDYFKKTITVDSSNRIISESEKEYDSAASDADWLKAQEKIKSFLAEFLEKIEWHYGENRAPFKYPPDFFIDDINIDRPYICEFEDDDRHRFRYSSSTPELLLEYIKSELPVQFNMFFDME